MSQDDVFKEVYNSLLGSREVANELTIKGFEEQDYEILLDTLLDLLVEEGVIHGNYYEWLYDRADARHKKKKRDRRKRYADDDFYDSLLAKSPEDYTTREQLTLVKFYLYRRVWCSNYGGGKGQVS